MSVFKGWLYCLLWYSSILSGYAGLFCPLLPILFVSNRLYRWCTDVLFTFWQYYPTVLLELLCNCEIQVSGDFIRTQETSLLVMNHRTRTDWNFLWPTVYHCVKGPGRFYHSTKFILKDIIRHIPGPGWVMQLACFIYIKRCWVQDELTLKKALNYFSKLSYKFTLVVFPEGTDLTTSTKHKSNLYADKYGLPHYEHVLHPRTTGFCFITEQLLKNHCLDAIYDVTLIYPDLIPQTESDLLNGKFPKTIYIHLTRYPKNCLPTSTDDLKLFLERCWFNKERTLKEFQITNQKHFLHGPILKQNNKFELLFALVFWSLLPFIVFFCFIFFDWFRHLIIAHTLLLILINFISDGFQNFEIALFTFKQKLFGYGF